VDDGWVAVGQLEQLEDQRSVRVDVEGQPVMLARDGERFFAVASRCTHQGASLQRGPLKFGALDQVTCPVHGSVFGLADGRVLRGPATAPLAVYDVRVTEGTLEVRPRP
jgi:nitrite reductase/ring-hydroxylating ferredoxin subunit